METAEDMGSSKTLATSSDSLSNNSPNRSRGQAGSSITWGRTASTSNIKCLLGIILSNEVCY